MNSWSLLLAGASGPDLGARKSVLDRAANVLRPLGALRRLDEMAAFRAGWKRTSTPAIDRPYLLLAAGDHGVARRGVSAYPSKVTAHMLEAFTKGVATATVLAEHLEVTVEVIDAGVGNPTGDLSIEDALDYDRFEECISLGREAVAGSGTDLLLLGEMGIGNTTAAAAVATSLYGGEVADWVGSGSGVDEPGLVRKREAVARGRSRVLGAAPAEVLRRVGGAELAVLAGACLEARLRSIPVLLDGFVVTAAVVPIEVEVSGGLDHCLAAHRSSEPGHRLLLDHLGLEPILDLDMRLGEGSGALVSLPILRLAIAGVTKVATFEEFGI